MRGLLTCQVLKSVPELFDARVGNHAVLAVQQVSLVVGKLLAECFSLPQAGVELLVNPGDKHRLEKHHRGNGPLMTARITATFRLFPFHTVENMKSGRRGKNLNYYNM